MAGGNHGMIPIRIFISSVQKEFATERAALRDYLRGDALMRRFFEVFFFEDVPAADRRADDLYLDQVRRCDLYVGLFGNSYGFEDTEGISPTEREFDLATTTGKYRLIYVKGTDDEARHPKMRALISAAQAGLVRKRFNTSAELVAGLYAALVEYLEEKQLIRAGPFDAASCMRATLEDLNPERMAWFLRTARKARRLPLSADAAPQELLQHLNLLLDDGQLTNAAILLFGKQPQRFLLSSEIKCAHFHGTEVAKPIPSYQVYKGTMFELVDDAVDFVLSKIALSVDTHEAGPQAPVHYEIPKEVVAEAIVNTPLCKNLHKNAYVSPNIM
jgi:ATP-dependent DNA helicase RecG